ncbi:MAG TPA: hypothetical protein VN019_06945 [Oxalicibacterium sp.]|nr:hypothetical protein [Oxalicibacterium sp.]
MKNAYSAMAVGMATGIGIGSVIGAALDNAPPAMSMLFARTSEIALSISLYRLAVRTHVTVTRSSPPA